MRKWKRDQQQRVLRPPPSLSQKALSPRVPAPAGLQGRAGAVRLDGPPAEARDRADAARDPAVDAPDERESGLCGLCGA
jgi:hypothetical protein